MPGKDSLSLDDIKLLLTEAQMDPQQVMSKLTPEERRLVLGGLDDTQLTESLGGVMGAPLVPPVGRMATGMATIAKEGAQAVSRQTAQHAPQIAKYLKELKFLQGMDRGPKAKAAYLKARPEVAAALKGAGSNIGRVIKHFESMLSGGGAP